MALEGDEMRVDGQKAQTERELSFTLEDLLALSAMAGAKLLAGGDRLDRPILRANVVEGAHLSEWSQAGDCVISSGYVFRGQDGLLLQELDALSAEGATVLCLKPTRFREDLPAVVVRRAAELDLPLIELPMTAIFANIVQESMEALFQRETRSFQVVQDKMEGLLGAFMGSDAPEATLAAVERAIANPLMIFDEENELLISNESRQLLLEPYQDDIIKQLYERSNGDCLLVRRDGGQVPVPVHFFDIGGPSGIRVIILEYYGPLSVVDQRVIGRISHLLAAEMKNAIAVRKIRRKYKQQFVENWLFGELGDAINICMSAQTDGYRISADASYWVAIVNLNTPRKDGAFLTQDVNVIRHIIRNLDSNIMFTVLEGKLILVVEAKKDRDEALRAIALLTEKLDYIMDKGDMSFCISDPHPIQDIPKAYQQAKTISTISSRCNIRDSIITYDKLGVLYLLALLPEDEAIRRYQEKYLRPLKEYDASHRTALYESLRIYLDAGCNTQKAAQAMHSHYNTVVYRIGQVERLLGFPIHDVETQLQIRIAYKLDQLHGEEPGEKR